MDSNSLSLKGLRSLWGCKLGSQQIGWADCYSSYEVDPPSEAERQDCVIWVIRFPIQDTQLLPWPWQHEGKIPLAARSQCEYSQELAMGTGGSCLSFILFVTTKQSHPLLSFLGNYIACDLLVGILSLCLGLEGKYEWRERNSPQMIGFGPIHRLRLTLWQRCGRHHNQLSRQSSFPGAFGSGTISLQWPFKRCLLPCTVVPKFCQ